MLFPTGAFALFFALVFLGHWALVAASRRGGERWLVADRSFLLVASLVFYAHWDWRFCFLLVGTGLWAWAMGLFIAHTPRQQRLGLLVLAIEGPLLVLGYFKYADFFLAEFGSMLNAHGLPTPALLGVVLPVGVSFFVFQAISYIVDVHRDEARAEASPLNVLVYICFFPHLAAGPIVRAAHFLPQVRDRPDASRIPFIMAGLLIAGGLAKKVLVANTLATGLVDPVFRDPEAASALDAALAIYGYAAQIYCDFSAYSDIAIGVAALLGFHFPRNFNQPYRAVTLSDFWRRWHISLSSWLRDYLYIPLGGSHHGALRTGIALMATMVLGGLWHGAAWRFVLWGALHGAGLMLERMIGLREVRSVLGRAIGMVLTFHVVCLGWVLFRAPDLEIAGGMLRALQRTDMEPVVATLPLAALCIAALLMHLLPPNWTARLERWLRPLPAPALGLALGAVVLLVVTLGPTGVAPFIYFQF